MLSPADEYVANFVKEVNRGRVVTVEAVMTPVPQSYVREGIKITPGTTVEVAARLILSTPGAHEGSIVGPDGGLMGIVNLRQLLGSIVNDKETTTAD